MNEDSRTLTRNRDCRERTRFHLAPPRLIFVQLANLPELVYRVLIKNLARDPQSTSWSEMNIP